MKATRATDGEGAGMRVGPLQEVAGRRPSNQGVVPSHPEATHDATTLS